MKKDPIISDTEKEAMIQKALRTGGFVSPETPGEVVEFEKKFGNTDMILPDELADLKFLNSKRSTKVVTLNTKDAKENLAMAAREGSKLPDDVLNKMKEHRKAAKKKK